MKSYDSAKMNALRMMQEQPELVAHGPGWMDFEFPEDVAARKAGASAPSSEPELLSESPGSMVFGFPGERRAPSVPSPSASPRRVELEPTVIEGRRDRMGAPRLEASSTIRRPAEEMRRDEPAMVASGPGWMDFEFPSEQTTSGTPRRVELEPTTIEGRRSEMGLAPTTPAPAPGTPPASTGSRVELEPTVIEGRPEAMMAKPSSSTATSVSEAEKGPKRWELRGVGPEFGSAPQSDADRLRAAQDADARYRWLDEMRRGLVGAVGGRNAVETRSIEPTAARDTAQAIQAERAGEERAQEASLRDPSSPESRRRQALFAQMVPDVPPEVVEQIPAADIDSGTVIRNLGAYRAAAQEAQLRSADRAEERDFRRGQQEDQQAFQQQQLEARNAQQGAMIELRNKLRQAQRVRGAGVARVGSNDELLQAAVAAGIPESAARNMRVRDLATMVARDRVADENRDVARSARGDAQEIAPGVRSTVQLSPPELRTARADITEASRGIAAIGEMRRIAREYGAAATISPEARQRINAALMPLRALAAQTQGTGVINPTEVPVISAALANPASLGQTTFGTFAAAADQWERSIENRLRGGLRGLGVPDDGIASVIGQARGGIPGGSGGGNRGNAQRQEAQGETVRVRNRETGAVGSIPRARLDDALRSGRFEAVR